MSSIADTEMARINIEASAALERWIDLKRLEPNRYHQLVRLAHGHLPMPRKTTRIGKEHPLLMTLAQPDIAEQLRAILPPATLKRAEAAVRSHPTRVLANAMVNYCWRNGPIEHIHAGSASSYPLTERRITPAEERRLVRETAAAFAQGALALDCLISDENPRSWSDSALPFGLAGAMGVSPGAWSLTERTRTIELPR